jgi:hypothetical protein
MKNEPKSLASRVADILLQTKQCKGKLALKLSHK